jgi:hypothetical protein
MVRTPRTPSRYSFSLIEPAKVPSYRIGSPSAPSLDGVVGAAPGLGLLTLLPVLFFFFVEVGAD